MDEGGSLKGQKTIQLKTLKEFIEILQVYSLEYYFILLFWLLE
jgi:hypothetical protein